MDEYINSMIKVFRAKDLIKYFIIMIIPLILIYCVIRAISNVNLYDNEIQKKIMYKIIDENVELMKKNESEQELTRWGKNVINSEYNLLNDFDKKDKNSHDNIKIAEETQ